MRDLTGRLVQHNEYGADFMPVERQSLEFTAILEHLTGVSKGLVASLTGGEIVVMLRADRKLCLESVDGEAPGEDAVAILRRAEANYTVEVLNDRDLWINRRLVRSADLRDGDMIEFGDVGPIVRYRRFEGSLPLRWTVAEMAGDSLAYLRSSRKPLGYRLRRAAGDLARRLMWQTTLIFRVSVIVVLLALIGFGYSLNRTNQLLEERIAAGSGQLESLALLLTQAREEALTSTDLAALREELNQKFLSNVERLAILERRSAAMPRVIREATGSIALLQIAFGLRDKASGRMMRHVVNADGMPVIAPQGYPILSLEGDGPVATAETIGTGFLLSDSRHIVTNRHVAMPWEQTGAGQAPETNSLEMVVLKFIAYFPGHADPIEVTLLRASETADLAVLGVETAIPGLAGLSLSETAPLPGEEVLVLGYPTGLRSLLAQAGDAFLQDLQAEKNTNFWSVAQRLSEAGLIIPLASRGIVAQVGVELLVYDAETTLGGSGGPVLNANGKVIAINTAVLPEFGGSNFGVTVDKLRPLLTAPQGN